MENHTATDNETQIYENQHGSTIMGLHKWYCNVFEKLGWMLLCRNDIGKVKVYYSGIQKLLEQLKLRLAGSPAPDTQKDLSYMITNTNILLAHIKKDFDAELSQRIELTGGAKKTKSSSKSKATSKPKSKPKANTKSKSKPKAKARSKSKAMR